MCNKNVVCIRCWKRRAQIHYWCERCFVEMYQIAKSGNRDPHTCQGPHCTQLAEIGKPLCPECEEFYQGAYHGA